MPRPLGLARWVGAIALSEGAVRVSADIFRLRRFRLHQWRGGLLALASGVARDALAKFSARVLGGRFRRIHERNPELALANMMFSSGRRPFRRAASRPRELWSIPDQVDDAVRSWDVVALIQRASSPTAMFSRLRPEARLVWAFDEGCRTDGAVGGVPRAPSAGFERLRTHRGYKGECEHTPSEPVRRAAE